MAQRALAAKSLREGQYGALFAGLLHLPLIFLLSMPGAAARVLYPDLAETAAAAGLDGQTDRLVFPQLMFDLLPTGLLGLVLAGFVAALMSSIDSAMNAGSTLATMDFYRRWRPEASAKTLMRVGQAFTFGFAVLAAIWAPQIERFPSFWDYLQGVLSFITPPIAACFLLGLFWRRANATGAVTGLAAGAVVGVGILVAQVGFGWWPGLHFLFVAGILFRGDEHGDRRGFVRDGRPVGGADRRHRLECLRVERSRGRRPAGVEAAQRAGGGAASAGVRGVRVVCVRGAVT